ncbi:MAG: hypothetical protein ACRD23_04505 [Terriglobales bacterium]
MKSLLLVLSAMMLLTLAGWGQMSPGQQAHASVAAHRREAKKNAKRHHQRRSHRRHHRKHTGA